MSVVAYIELKVDKIIQTWICGNDDIIAREQSNNKRINYRCKACRLSPNFLFMFLRAKKSEQ